MPLAELQHVELHYELSGRRGAPVLVLSNSLGTMLSLWEPQLAALEKHFEVLRYDMRGHGQSSVPTGTYSIEEMGQDLLGLLDALQMDSVHFCGISIGGLIGQWLAVHAPQRFRRMVFSNTAAKIGTFEGWNQRIEQVRRQGMSSITDSVLARWFSGSFVQAQPETMAWMRAMLLKCDPEGYTGACAAVRDVDLRESVKRIPLSVCVIAGEHDPATTVADAEWLQGQIGRARLVRLPASHIANVEAAEAFNEALLEFFGA